MDYYKILGLDSANTTIDDIANSFRTNAVKCHPMRNKDSIAVSHQEFSRVCEAYDVLSQPWLKTQYDKVGEVGLKNGTTRKKDGKSIGGYCFKGNSLEIFELFFGHANPFTDDFKDLENANAKKANDDPDDINVTLGCTIHEFYNGSIKNVFFTRNQLLPDEKTGTKIEDSMNVEIKAGYDVDTVLTFSSKGNEEYARKQSALKINFSLEPSENCNFKRDGDDLIYTHTLSLEDALQSCPVKIRTLDNRYINFCIDTMITPQTVHKIAGEGMPRKANNQEKGDLYVKFNIQFPQNFKTEYRSQIIELLK